MLPHKINQKVFDFEINLPVFLVTPPPHPDYYPDFHSFSLLPCCTLSKKLLFYEIRTDYAKYRLEINYDVKT